MTVHKSNSPKKGFGANNMLCGTKSLHKISDVISSGESQVSRSLHTKGLMLHTVMFETLDYVE